MSRARRLLERIMAAPTEAPPKEKPTVKPDVKPDRPVRPSRPSRPDPWRRREIRPGEEPRPRAKGCMFTTGANITRQA